MRIRSSCARSFYAGARSATIDDYVADWMPPAIEDVLCGGVVPHAGWFFSGRTAARVFATVARQAERPRAFVFLGAVHRAALDAPAVDPAGAWETAFGPLAIDEALAREIVEANIGCAADPDAHREEHSIEVSLPFIIHFFPEATFVPIACPPHGGADAFGTRLGALLRGRRVAVVASTDLTHYGESYGFAPVGSAANAVLEFMAANDNRILGFAAALDAPAVLAEARDHANACGGGALAAAVAAARAMGARRGTLIDYRTSHDALPEDPIERAVGYGGMVFA